MNAGNKVNIKKLYNKWPLSSHFAMLCGFSVFPITYNSKQYVVDFKISLNAFDAYGNVIGKIYEYSENKRLFKGNRGKLIHKTDVTELKLVNGKNIRIDEISYETFVCNLKEIIEFVFLKYKKEKTEQERINILFNAAKQWDGVIELS